LGNERRGGLARSVRRFAAARCLREYQIFLHQNGRICPRA
jgi:hypothetical protein